MKLDPCERETAVLESVRAGRWPNACEEELRAHVAQCAVCAEVVLVAEVLRQADSAAHEEVRLPAPGFVWWKAQIRARRLAAERAAAPITLAAQLAGAFAALAFVGLAIWQWSRVADWWNGLKFLPSKETLWPGTFSTGLWSPHLLLIGSMLLGLALISVVLYVLLARE